MRQSPAPARSASPRTALAASPTNITAQSIPTHRASDLGYPPRRAITPSSAGDRRRGAPLRHLSAQCCWRTRKRESAAALAEAVNVVPGTWAACTMSAPSLADVCPRARGYRAAAKNADLALATGRQPWASRTLRSARGSDVLHPMGAGPTERGARRTPNDRRRPAAGNSRAAELAYVERPSVTGCAPGSARRPGEAKRATFYGHPGCGAACLWADAAVAVHDGAAVAALPHAPAVGAPVRHRGRSQRRNALFLGVLAGLLGSRRPPTTCTMRSTSTTKPRPLRIRATATSHSAS